MMNGAKETTEQGTNIIAEILETKKRELPTRAWCLPSAERVFLGEESPVPFEVWKAAGKPKKRDQ